MAFDRLATGECFRKAQSSRLAGKMADRREALDARRETFGELSSLALELLNGVGHNPIAGHTTASTLHSKHYPPTYRLPMAQLLGALTQDEDPPGARQPIREVSQCYRYEHDVKGSAGSRRAPA